VPGCHQGRSSTASLNARIGKAEDDNVPERKLSFSDVHYFAAGASLFGNDAQVGYQYATSSMSAGNMHAPGFQTAPTATTPRARAGAGTVHYVPCRR